MKAFLCHNSQDSPFVIQVAQHLKRSLDVFYFEEHQRADEGFPRTLNTELAACEVVVVFVGASFSPWQEKEANTACKLDVDVGPRKFFVVCLRDPEGQPYPVPASIAMLGTYPVLTPQRNDAAGARTIAARVVRELGRPWNAVDGLPRDPHLFSYEKDILDFYIRKTMLGDALFTEEPASPRDAEERRLIREKLLDGCPAGWPEVVHWKDPAHRRITNRLSVEEYGERRPEDAGVLCKALLGGGGDAPEGVDTPEAVAIQQRLRFPEAGPREHLYFPRRGGVLNVAVLVSGGIAPGINAVIDGIVQRHWAYARVHGWANGLTIYGLRNGFLAFDDLRNAHCLLASDPNDYAERHAGAGHVVVTADHLSEGGSILGTARVDELLDPACRIERLGRIAAALRAWHIDILYVIGGDGSMKAAHALWSVAEDQAGPDGPQLSVVTIPKTMDNDILWVWQSFGFLSAVEKAREFIEELRTEVSSNPRLCVVQLFGSDSGFVVSHAVLATGTGHCTLALIPEVPFSMGLVAEYLTRTLCRGGPHIPFGLVVMSETAIPTDALRYTGDWETPVADDDGFAALDDAERRRRYDVGLSEGEKEAIREFDRMRRRGERIQGQTNDELRRAGLRIVSEGLKRRLPDAEVAAVPGCLADWDRLRVFTSEPRHLLRAIPPSCSDIIIGQRLGTLAVDNAMAGYTDFMISQWLTEFVLVPLKLVTLGRKRIPTQGIFWKSVRTKTGQPGSLVSASPRAPSGG